MLFRSRDEIINLDVNNLTPLEALNKLTEIKRILNGWGADSALKRKTVAAVGMELLPNSTFFGNYLRKEGRSRGSSPPFYTNIQQKIAESQASVTQDGTAQRCDRRKSKTKGMTTES